MHKMEKEKKGLSVELIIFLVIGVTLPLVILMADFLAQKFSVRREVFSEKLIDHPFSSGDVLSKINKGLYQLENNNQHVNDGVDSFQEELDSIYDRMEDGRFQARVDRNRQKLEQLYGNNPRMREFLDNEYWIEEKIVSLDLPDFYVIEENLGDVVLLRDVVRKLNLRKGYGRTYCQKFSDIMGRTPIKTENELLKIRKKTEEIGQFCRVQEDFLIKSVERYSYIVSLLQNANFDKDGNPLLSQSQLKRLGDLYDQWNVLLLSWISEMGKLGQSVEAGI